MDEDALRALMLQIEWGADEALAEEAVARLAPARPERADPQPPARRPAPDALPEAPIAAAEAGDLDALRRVIAAFRGCALRDTATGPVLPEGDAARGLLVIYGPPSDEDDRACRPLSGPAGRYFDAMLASAGLDRGSVLIAPLVPWRPPGGRPPSPPELALCLPFLHRLVALARPRLVLLMGAQTSRAILGPERRAQGTLLRAEVPGSPEPVACIALAAPAELFRNPDQRPAAWAALRRAMRVMQDAYTVK